MGLNLNMLLKDKLILLYLPFVDKRNAVRLVDVAAWEGIGVEDKVEVGAGGLTVKIQE